MTIVKRRTAVRPVPRGTPPSKKVEFTSCHSELNVIAAIVRTGDVQAARDAGLTADDFSDEEYAVLFGGVLEHYDTYGQAPSWMTLQAYFGNPSREQPKTPEPLAYYVERLHRNIKYDWLAEGAQEVVHHLYSRDVDKAVAAMTETLADVNDYENRTTGRARLLRGSDMLAAPYEPLQWLVEGVWVKGSYGMVGGAEKSLKSYVTMAMALAVASGAPFLGRFDVPSAVPVLAYVGEGGRNLYQSRLKRVAASMELEPPDLEHLHVEFAAGALDNDAALSRLSQAANSTDAGLVLIDPWYRFQGGTTNGANLFEQGSLLSDVRDAVGDAALVIVHHFNQTGPKTGDLKRLTLAGAAEWVDSWMLLNKDYEDVEAGEFVLNMGLGSRHWGGRSWKVAADIGRIDDASHQHVGDVRLSVAGDDDLDRCQPQEPSVDPDEETRQRALELLAAGPWSYTKTELQVALGGNKSRTLKVLQSLLESGRAEKKPSSDRPRVEVWNAT